MIIDTKWTGIVQKYAEKIEVFNNPGMIHTAFVDIDGSSHPFRIEYNKEKIEKMKDTNMNIVLCHEIGHTFVNNEPGLKAEILAWEKAWGVFHSECDPTQKEIKLFLEDVVISLETYGW